MSGPLNGNQLEPSEGEEDEDEDGEALLYKMMQQQTFLMNPIFQEAQVSPAASQPTGGELANSKKVIKLLKSYSHIHQVDDSDDQIRGTHTRLSAQRPSSAAPARQQSR